MLKLRGRADLVESLSAVADSRDRAILAALVERGDRLTEARPIRFVFWRYASDMRGSGPALDPLARAAEAAGYRVADRMESSIALEIEQALAPELVNARRALMLDWARRFKIDFRGWECAAVAAKRTFPFISRRGAEAEPA
jgi:hypothetical protein